MTNEEKIMKELRERDAKGLKSYETFLKLIQGTDAQSKGDRIIIGEEDENNHDNESADNQPTRKPPEYSPESPKRGAWWKILLFLFSPLLFIFIYAQIESSDIIQRTVNPQKYWRKQVATLEEEIYKTQLYIKDWESFSSEKYKTSINYDSLVRKLIIEGKEPEEAKQIASDTIKEIDKAEKETDDQMIKAREQMLESSYKSLNDYKRQLEQARKELSVLQ